MAADQGGESWTGLCQQIATEWSKASPFVEAVAEGPLGGAVSGGVGLEDVMAMMGNLAGSLLLGAIADSSALEGYIAGARWRAVRRPWWSASSARSTCS